MSECQYGCNVFVRACMQQCVALSDENDHLRVLYIKEKEEVRCTYHVHVNLYTCNMLLYDVVQRTKLASELQVKLVTQQFTHASVYTLLTRDSVCLLYAGICEARGAS